MYKKFYHEFSKLYFNNLMNLSLHEHDSFIKYHINFSWVMEVFVNKLIVKYIPIVYWNIIHK